MNMCKKCGGDGFTIESGHADTPHENGECDGDCPIQEQVPCDECSTAVSREINAIDITLGQAESKGIAYYRIEDGFLEFLRKVEKRGKIIGFQYDGSRNFGVIIGK